MSDTTNEQNETIVPFYAEQGGLEFYAIEQQLMDGKVTDHTYTAIGSGERQLVSLNFQTESTASVGANGLTNESLIAVLLHRLRFLNAQLPSRNTALAISNLVQAATLLEARSTNRQVRQVEGTEEA